MKHGLTIEGFGQAGNAKFAHIDYLSGGEPARSPAFKSAARPSTADCPSNVNSPMDAASEMPTSNAAYGAAAANASVDVSIQTWVASVRVPLGESSSVELSSVTTEM